MTTLAISRPCPSLARLHTRFEQVLPLITRLARRRLRFIKRHTERDDLLADVLGLCWAWFRRLARRGKNACRFARTLADFAVRRVLSGRRLCGQQCRKDLFSYVAQRQRGFTVHSLPQVVWENSGLEEALIDNRHTPVPEQVHFRCDFPAWLLTRSRRDRLLIADLGRGERPGKLAQRLGLTAGRLSQLRGEFRRDWLGYIGEDDAA